MSFVNQYRSTTIYGELKVQKYNTGNINGLLDISGNTILRGDVGINGNLYATDGTVDISGNLTVTGDAIINTLTVGRGSGNITDNTALGGGALAANTTGSNNTALGKDALLNNTTGGFNTAVGYGALETNDTGDLNTAVGRNALLDNTGGGSNTGIGYEALNANTTGSNNTSVGQSSMSNNLTGSFNTAVGDNSLDTNTTGSNNTALGADAGFTNLTGSNNTFLGYNTDISGNVVYNHSTALGADAKISASNQIVLGTASDSVLIRGPLSVTGTITGTATNVNVTEVSSGSFRVPFLSGNSGSQTISSDAGITYNPASNVLSTCVSTVTQTAAGLSSYRVCLAGNSVGEATSIVSNSGLVYNTVTDTLDAGSLIRSTDIDLGGSLVCARNGGQGSGVWLVNGSTANTALEAIIPLFCSQTNLGNINNQGSLTEVSVSGSVVGSYITNFSVNNLIDVIVLFPGWGIIGYDGTGYSSTVRINMHNNQATPVFAQTSSANTLSSCKIYYDKVERTGLGS